MRVAENPSCAGCPLYGDGSQPYTPDQHKQGATVEVRFETTSSSRAGLPKLERDYYKLAGLTSAQVSISHAVRCGVTLPAPVSPAQWEAGKRGDLERGVAYCERVHSRVHGGDGLGRQPSRRLLVALGDLALQSATGQRSAHEWRGWLLPYQSKSDSWLNDIWTPGQGETSTLAMVPLEDLHGLPTLGYAMQSDWKKVGKVLRGEWPQPFPGYETRPPAQWPRLSAFDTEFDPQGRLERYSLYDGRTLYVVEASSVRTLELPGEVTVVMHNVEADIAHLQSFLHGGSVKTEDTMLMHSVLWSDLPHSLEYLGSLYARTNRWKHLFRRSPRNYAGGDALGTWDVYLSLVHDMQADSQSAWVYRHAVFPLTSTIMEAEIAGLRVDQDRVQTALAYHTALQDEAEQEAQAYSGYPMNLGSPDQIGRWLYEVERVGAKKRSRR